MFEFTRFVDTVFEVQHKLDMVTPVISNILEHCTCGEKRIAQITHYLKPLIPASLEQGLRVGTYL